MYYVYLYKLLFLLSSISISQGTFCSEDDRNVHCVPCNFNSTLKQIRCPDQCNSQGKQFCKEVCNSYCINNQCKYEDGSLKCTKGCIGGLMGKTCQEKCPLNCARCDQFTSICFCEGANCNEKLTTTPKADHSTGFTLKKSTTKIPKLQTTRWESVTSGSWGVTTTVGHVIYSTRKQGRGTAIQENSSSSGLHFLLAGIVVAVVVACSIATITFILIRRKKREKTTPMNI